MPVLLVWVWGGFACGGFADCCGVAIGVWGFALVGLGHAVLVGFAGCRGYVWFRCFAGGGLRTVCLGFLGELI